MVSDVFIFRYDDYKYTAAAFNDDEDQTRWFYFKSNGKMVKSDEGDRTKDKNYQW